MQNIEKHLFKIIYWILVRTAEFVASEPAMLPFPSQLRDAKDLFRADESEKKKEEAPFPCPALFTGHEVKVLH